MPSCGTFNGRAAEHRLSHCCIGLPKRAWVFRGPLTPPAGFASVYQSAGHHQSASKPSLLPPTFVQTWHVLLAQHRALLVVGRRANRWQYVTTASCPSSCSKLTYRSIGSILWAKRGCGNLCTVLEAPFQLSRPPAGVGRKAPYSKANAGKLHRVSCL